MQDYWYLFNALELFVLIAAAVFTGGALLVFLVLWLDRDEEAP